MFSAVAAANAEIITSFLRQSFGLFFRSSFTGSEQGLLAPGRSYVLKSYVIQLGGPPVWDDPLGVLITRLGKSREMGCPRGGMSRQKTT